MSGRHDTASAWGDPGIFYVPVLTLAKLAEEPEIVAVSPPMTRPRLAPVKSTVAVPHADASGLLWQTS
jgi:hypothetical protein